MTEPESNLSDVDIEQKQAIDDEKAIGDLLEGAEDSGEQINDPYPPEAKPIERGAQSPPEKKEEEIVKPPTPPVEPVEVPVAKEISPPKSKEEIEKELEEIQPRKGDHPNVIKGIDAMKDKVRATNELARQAFDQANQYKTKITELEKQTVPAEVEKELTELRTFRRMFDMQSDPVFKQKYDEPIKAIAKDTLALLGAWGLPEKIVGFIEKRGGPIAMRFSQTMMPDGVTTEEEWFESEILGKMNGAQKREAVRQIDKALDLQDKKKDEISSIQKDAEAWEKEREKNIEASQKQWSQKADSIRDDMVKKLGIMGTEWTPTDKATPEEIEIATTHNARLKKSAETYGNIVGRMEPEIEIPKAFAAAQAEYLNGMLGDANKRIAKLEAELAEKTGTVDKIKKAGRTAKQSNAPAEIKTSPMADWKKDDHTALEEAFKKLEP